MIDLQRLGRALRGQRLERGMSQAELAMELGIAQGTVSYFERGVQVPDVNLYLKLCDWLGVSMDTFRTSPTDVQAA